MIIDFHTHTFPDAICAKVIDNLSKVSCTKAFTDGSINSLQSSMKNAGIDYSVNLPVMTNLGQVEKINNSMINSCEALKNNGIITFGGLHPEYEDYRTMIKRLKDGGIKGIKLHPAYQNVDLNDIRMMNIIDAAAEEDMIILIHAGIDIGIYDHDYSSVKQIIEVVDKIGPSKFVLAHMGGWGCWDDVERDLCGAPVYLDTAFSIGKITSRPDFDKAPIRSTNLDEEQFIRLVRKHGSDKVLFATDSPWEEQSDYVERLQSMSLNDNEKNLILGKNAEKLLF